MKDSVATAILNKPDTANIIKDSHYFWIADLEQKNGLVMKKTDPICKDSLTPVIFIGMINAEYPEIRLQFVRISNDSIFVKIKNSKYLTQQMGTSGADAYLAEVTYNLTELENITHVNVSFKLGDHANPGTYERIDFLH